jgi:CRISPR-associated endonuclease/helicase Cas3
MQQLDQDSLPLPLKSLSAEQKVHMRSVFETHPDHSYNADIIRDSEDLASKSINQFTERSKKSLNDLRSVLAANALETLRNNMYKRLFFLEAPTGSGKTNISMLLLHHLFKEDPSIERVFYVFPFTTLADQTIGEFKDRFGLSNQDVTALHSKAFHTYTKNTEDESDADYGDHKTFYLQDLFGNEAITLTSHVTFWNMLKSSRKQDIYRFCQLTNSVVIFDEIQAYPPEHWDKINFFLEEASEKLNMRCIVMSATLPDIGKLTMNDDKGDIYTRLISEEKRDQFFTNPNFGNRVEMISEEGRLFDGSVEALADFITKETRQCVSEDKWNGIRVIVECIKKATATNLYQEIQKSDYWDDFDLLSGTILEPERHTILNKLKEEKKENEKYILVTTQVVEAGVNIDMDIGFKDSSLLDSDEQLAGRINRNAADQPSKLFLFNFDDAKHIYRNDQRLKVPKEQPGITEKFRKQKDFKSYYHYVLNQINTLNEIDVIGGLKDYKQHFNNLDYNSVHNRFKIIDSDTIPVFIPLSFHLTEELGYDDQISATISELELQFDLTEGNELSGEKVWRAFRSVSKAETDFIIQSKQIKQLLPLVNLFTFPVYNDSKLVSQLREFSHHEEDTVDRSSRGYIYLHRWDEVYDKKEGLTLNEETMDACRIM